MQPCGGAPGNLTRTLPVSTVTNNAVDIGTFYGVTSFYGLANYSISISAGSPINVAKIYQVAISGDGANVWRKVLPISSTGTANGDGSDFDLEVKTDGNPITYFRIRKTAGSSTVALKINLVQNSGVADFTGSTATSSPSAPTTIWPTTGTVALAGTTGSIGGGALAASCATGTATVLGATTDMAATASPAGGVDPIGSAPAVSLSARVSAADTVTVSLCGTGTPTAAAYNVRVVQ